MTCTSITPANIKCLIKSQYWAIGWTNLCVGPTQCCRLHAMSHLSVYDEWVCDVDWLPSTADHDGSYSRWVLVQSLALVSVFILTHTCSSHTPTHAVHTRTHTHAYRSFLALSLQVCLPTKTWKAVLFPFDDTYMWVIITFECFGSPCWPFHLIIDLKGADLKGWDESWWSPDNAMFGSVQSGLQSAGNNRRWYCFWLQSIKSNMTTLSGGYVAELRSNYVRHFSQHLHNKPQQLAFKR